MKVSVAGIYDRGTLDKERVHFRADTDLNLSFFVLLDTMRINMTAVSAGNLSAYWFPPRAIPRGQHIVVYTRAGTANMETRKDGSIYHFLFRGLPNPLYAHPQACVVVTEVQTWVSTFIETAALPPLPPATSPLGLAAASLPYYGEAGRLTGIAEGPGIAQLGDILKPKS